MADRGYDASSLRRDFKAVGRRPIIPGRRNRKRPIQHHSARYAERWRIEVMFRSLADYRRVATPYDKLATRLARREAEIEVFSLPCYSPELNPDEGLNSDPKQAVTC
jgi:transposase